MTVGVAVLRVVSLCFAKARTWNMCGNTSEPVPPFLVGFRECRKSTQAAWADGVSNYHDNCLLGERSPVVRKCGNPILRDRRSVSAPGFPGHG